MEKLPDTINKTLDALAARFGATGHELLVAYVHYIQLYALACLVLGTGSCVILYRIVSTLPKAKDDFDEAGLRLVRVVGAIALVLAAAGFVGANFADIVDPRGAAVFYLVHGK
jgi:hypothetical protein